MPSVLLGVLLLALVDDKAAAKEALAPFNELVGSWRGSGSPNLNNAAERRKGSWSETLTWTWQLKGEPRLLLDFKDGKRFRSGVLRWRPAEKDFELELTAADGAKHRFTGKLESQQLNLAATDAAKGEDQRLVFHWLHGSRLLYRLETKAQDERSFTKRFQVGATKEGAEFAKASGDECVVTGGAAAIRVTYQGKTYYVCCTGCKEAFEENPEQVLREYAERKAKEKAEKAKK